MTLDTFWWIGAKPAAHHESVASNQPRPGLPFRSFLQKIQQQRHTRRRLKQRDVNFAKYVSHHCPQWWCTWATPRHSEHLKKIKMMLFLVSLSGSGGCFLVLSASFSYFHQKIGRRPLPAPERKKGFPKKTRSVRSSDDTDITCQIPFHYHTHK